MVFVIVILYSGCMSKDGFFRGWYNSIQNDNNCQTSQECNNKEIYPKQKISYDEYKQQAID